MKYLSIILVLMLSKLTYAEDVAQYLQNISVTVKSNYSSGSGVIITREIEVSDKDETTETVNFVLTASHVIKSLRSVRDIIVDGKEKKVVEFKDASLVKQLIENGRRVGKLEMDCKVLKYSDSENGEDLALLMVRKRNFVNTSTNFYLKKEIVPIGTRLFHIGSLLGEAGSNSMTDGIMSQIGRTLNLGSGGGIVFDQSSVVAWPGSSGGGIFLADGNNKGEYVGMLVRGSGSNFNFLVPIRRIKKWAKINNILWILDPNVKIPYLEEILKMSIEDASTTENKSDDNKNQKSFPFLLDILQK